MAADALPLEVLSHIFKFLSVSDRKQSALVCRRWYDATLDPYLQRDVIFRVMPAAMFSEVDPESFSSRKGIHLALNTMDDCSSSCSPQALQRMPPHAFPKLVGLSLRGTDMTESAFADFISRCTRLVSLSVAYCDSLVMSGATLAKCLASVSLESLRELDLSHMRHLSDQTLMTFLGICPHLESLRLASDAIVYKSARLYYDPPRSKPSSGVLTFACLVDALSRLTPTLRRLDLSATAVDDASLAELAALDGLRLEEMSLAACREVSNTGIASLCARQQCLHSLDLSHAPSLTDGFAGHLASALPNLRRLTLTKCSAVTGAGVRSLLASLRELEALSVSGCHRVDDSGFFSKDGKALLALVPRLSKLELSYCGMISDRVIVAACNHLRHLTHLDLTSCILLTDVSVAAITRGMPGLTFLSLAWCKDITDFGIMGVVAPPDHVHAENGACKCLRDASTRVQFSSFLPIRLIAPAIVPPTLDKLERTVAESYGGPSASIASLSHLATLRLAACIRLSDVSLSLSLRHVELRELDLDLCHAITDVTVIAVAENNPSLEALSIAQCANVTDVGVAAVLRHCRRLARLNLSGCTKLTDGTLLNVKALQVLTLRRLDVSLCNMTSCLVDSVQHAMPNLSIIYRRHTEEGN